MSQDKSFYITTAIPYVNAAPHLGHAMEFIETDAIARYKRLMGYDTFFLTGTDEHGVKNYKTAAKVGMNVHDFTEKYATIYKELTKTLTMSNDDFIQTKDQKRHWPACQKLWKKMRDKGDIFEKEYEGLYCEGCEMYVLEKDLIEGKCAVHKTEPSLLKEKNYFFKLSKYSEQIVKLIESKKLTIYPDFRKTEFLNLAKEGLLDVSFSRPRSVLPWGVDVPDDPDQVMYVWGDALTNYISAMGYAEETERFKTYWPADLHVIGKDIVRFHAGIWIGMLLSAELEIPKGIMVHGFVTHNGEKMSKTTGNVVDPIGIVDKYGVDALRYYILREIPTGRDGDFNDDIFIERYNSDLANNFGNLVNRVHTLIARNDIPDFSFNLDSDLYKKEVDKTWSKYTSKMDEYDIYQAIQTVVELMNFANKQIEDTKPWALIKEDLDKGRGVLCNLLEIIRHLTILLSPIIPTSCENIRQQIGLNKEIDSNTEHGWGALEGDWNSLNESSIVFPRIES